MTEDRRLRDKLDKLAGEGAGGARRLAGGAGDEALRAILAEIDETILARTLAFEADDGEILRVEAANRRILAVLDIPPGALAGTDGDALAEALSAEDDAALATVAAALRRFAEGRSGLAVVTAPLGRNVGLGARGRSAAALASALGIELYPDRPAPVAAPDHAQGFDAWLAQVALAVATVSGGAPGPAEGRDADAVARLSALGAEGLAALARELGPEDARAGRFLLLAGEGEALFLGHKAGGRAVAAIVPADHAGVVAAQWQATGGA